jgi:acetylornithine aminotransferase/acetylornithine/N-succinyldiaminopimelate aminotransferase
MNKNSKTRTHPAIVKESAESIQGLYQKNVIPSYGRLGLVLSHGSGSHVWDVNGKRYLDLGGGIAVCSLGHSSPDITQALIDQSRTLVHVSNLYYHAPQAHLAERLAGLIAPGKLFFCNSGAEANEGLYKVARKFGHDQGRFEIITALNSFHGRTLAGIAATGQDKVKKGFEPIMPGFRYIPYNNLQAAREAISPGTIAILIEGIQGEGGVTPATPEYLLGLRQLCDEKGLLLLMDGVQDGHFRTGRFQCFQRILEGVPGGENFLPDGVSMAKSLAGGIPMGAFWIRQPYADLLGPGSHATTFGGTPLACAVALKVLEVIERDHLADNARKLGNHIKARLEGLAAKYPRVIQSVRGLGLMIGFQLADGIPAFAGKDKPPGLLFVNRLHEAGVMTIPSGTHVIRILPPLNLTEAEAEEGLNTIESIASELAS